MLYKPFGGFSRTRKHMHIFTHMSNTIESSSTTHKLKAKYLLKNFAELRLNTVGLNAPQSEAPVLHKHLSNLYCRLSPMYDFKSLSILSVAM